MKIGINVFPLYSGHKLRGIGYYTKNLLSYLKKEKGVEIQEFTNLSEVKNAQAIHYPWFDLYFHTLPIKRNFPTVVTIHDVIPLMFPEHYPAGFRGKINFHLQKIALNSCKYIITDSETSKKDILKDLKVNKEKVIVIPLAADPVFKVLKDPQLLRVKRKYNLPERFLMYAGDANFTKNLPFLVGSFRKLINITKFSDVKMVLVGGVFLKNVENIDHLELKDLKKLNRMIKEYRMEDRIIRPGNIDEADLVAFYNLATLYIQPSLYEGFGLPLLQSFACGTPVVSSNSGSLPEVGGHAAVYFDPCNSNQLVSILTEILPDKSSQCKLSKLGHEQARKFSWERTVGRTIEVYKQATNAH